MYTLSEEIHTFLKGVMNMSLTGSLGSQAAIERGMGPSASDQHPPRRMTAHTPEVISGLPERFDAAALLAAAIAIRGAVEVQPGEQDLGPQPA